MRSADCHPDRRHYGHGLCNVCWKAKRRRDRGAPIQNVRTTDACACGKALHTATACRSCYDKQLKQKNPDYAARQKKNNAEWIDKNKPRVKAYASNYMKTTARFKRYGVTREWYEQKVESQGGACAICRKPCTNALCIDHNHQTGKVRELLCARCNTGLGSFLENPEIMNKAIDYIRRHSVT